MNGSVAANAHTGRSPSRTRMTMNATATATLMTATGVLSMAIVGPPTQKNCTASYAWTPSM